MSRMKFMNTEIDNLTMEEALEAIDQLIEKNKSAYVVTPNVDHIVQLETNKELQDVYENASLILTDGKPLLWIAKWYGTPIKEKISGSDLFPRLCDMAAKKGYKMFFLGAAEGVAAKAAENLRNRYKGLQVVGTYSPPFGFEKNQNEMEKIKSNYEIMKERMAERFLTYDQEGIIRKLSLRADEEYLYLTFLSFGYRVNRRNGGIQWFDRTAGRWREAQYNDAMTIYDLLCCSKEDGRASGQYVMLQNLVSVASGTMFAGKGILEQEAKGLDHRDEELAAACERLGGSREKTGDVAYKIPVWENLCVIFRFWNSDEEFPAQVQFLCDRNMLDFMHYETAWFLVSHIILLLKQDLTGHPPSVVL